MTDSTASETPSAPLIAYKAFDKDLKCRDFQFEVGKTYEHTGPVKACSSGFHACLRPLDVLAYYPPTSRFAVVEVAGEVSTDDEGSKIAAAKLTVKAEIGLPEIITKTVERVIAQCKPTEGASNSGARGAASNSGYYGAASNSGARGAASNSGAYGVAASYGLEGRVSGVEGSALFLVERNDDWSIKAVWSGIVGKKKIKPNTWYALLDGKPVEVSQ